MEQRHEAVALARVTLRARDRVAPRGRIGWIAGKEVGDARVIEDVVGSESPNPRESADVDGKPGAWSRIRMRAGVLWWLVGEAGVGLQPSVLLQSLKRSVKKPVSRKLSRECYDRQTAYECHPRTRRRHLVSRRRRRRVRRNVG